MDKELVSGELGKVGAYKLVFMGGKLVLSAEIVGGPLGVEASVKLGAAELIDAIAAAIPGKVDDAILGVIKAALLEV